MWNPDLGNVEEGPEGGRNHEDDDTSLTAKQRAAAGCSGVGKRSLTVNMTRARKTSSSEAQMKGWPAGTFREFHWFTKACSWLPSDSVSPAQGHF